MTSKRTMLSRWSHAGALALAAVLMLGTVAAAAELPGAAGNRIARLFFSAEQVMANQGRLGLSAFQREELIREMQETQVDIVPLQARMQAATEELVQSLKGHTHLDEGRVVGLAGEVLQLEAEIKQRHLRLLIRIKNLLTEEQQRKLWVARAAARERGRR